MTAVSLLISSFHPWQHLRPLSAHTQTRNIPQHFSGETMNLILRPKSLNSQFTSIKSEFSPICCNWLFTRKNVYVAQWS